MPDPPPGELLQPLGGQVVAVAMAMAIVKNRQKRPKIAICKIIEIIQSPPSTTIQVHPKDVGVLPRQPGMR